MKSKRTEAQRQVGLLLRTARESLGLSTAFLSRLDGVTQHLELLESSIPFVARDGITQKQQTSLCQAIFDKKLPAVMGDLRDYPVAMALPAARFPRIRSFVSVPVVFSDGSVYGSFCGAGLTANPKLQERDVAFMHVLAQAAASILEPESRSAARGSEILRRLEPLIRSGGPSIVFQPVVDLVTRKRVGLEALSRFPTEWGLAPDVAFEQAHSVGVGNSLELLAITRAASYLASLDGFLAINLSASVLMTTQAQDTLRGLPLERIVVELSEHEQVDDYGALATALEPLRARGMRLAIDDVGAGFSSLRHIVQTSPDIIKLDRSIVAGIAEDTVLSTLASALHRFAEDLGAETVAEGVEDRLDAEMLCELGIEFAQGWHFGRPMPVEQLDRTDQV